MPETCDEPCFGTIFISKRTGASLYMDFSVPRWCNEPPGHTGSHVYRMEVEDAPRQPKRG